MRIYFLTFFLLFFYQAESETAFDDPVIQKIVLLHDQALKGNLEDVKVAEEKMNLALLRSPSNQLVKAYLGSLLTIKSSKVGPGVKKWKYFTSGLKTLDAAVEAAPHDPAVRLVRAMNNWQLPLFFNRKDDARNDFKILFEQLENSNTHSFDSSAQQAIYYYAGIAFLKTKAKVKAKLSWEKGLSLGKKTDLGKKIQEALNQL